MGSAKLSFPGQEVEACSNKVATFTQLSKVTTIYQQQVGPLGLILSPPIGMAHHSDKAKWGAYFAMREAEGDHILAAKYYKKWVPEEPVSKWKDFATRVYKAVKSGLGAAPAAKPGPKPKITDELALRIGTVYTQRLVWEHGKCRHYRDMNEVRRRLRPRPPPSGCAPPAAP